MSMINGIGAKYIGCSEEREDGSYVTTRWVMFILPVVPTGSFRVLPTSHVNLGVFSSSEFQVQSVPLYWPHVVWMYGIYFAAAVYVLLMNIFGSRRATGIIAIPFLSSTIASVLSVILVRICDFIRKESMFVFLLALIAIIILSFVAALNMSGLEQETRAFKYMCLFWVAYAIFAVIKRLSMNNVPIEEMRK